MGSGAALGRGDATGAVGFATGIPIATAAIKTRTTSPAMTARSIRFIGRGCDGCDSCSSSGRRDGHRRGRGRQAVVVGAKMNEASEKTTNRISRTIVNCHSRRSMPRRLRYTAESPPKVPGQAGAAGLEQDREHERDAHDDLADGQGRIHWGRPPLETAADDSTGFQAVRTSDRPVIEGHRRQADQVADRRRDVGEHAIAERRALDRPTSEQERDRVQRVGRDRVRRRGRASRRRCRGRR